MQKAQVRFSKILIEDMFKVQPNETVIITADEGSNKETVNALFAAAKHAKALPLILWMPKAKKDSQAGMQDWPSEAVTGALQQADVWVEANSRVILYSDIWETVMHLNKKVRYLIIAESSIASLERVFTGFDIQLLKGFLSQITDIAKKSKKVCITSSNGTNVSYEIDLNHAFDYDDGDYSEPKFGTAPGFVNIVPKLNSMNGNIVFDHLQHAEEGVPLEFKMRKGVIVDVLGGETAEKFKSYLASFQDENMYKISHNMLGFNPNVRALTGELVEDERIWGGVDFGFGHTSSIDMPPLGQVAKSHFDGVVANTSICFDNIQLTHNGEVCHEELKFLANALLNDIDA